MDSIFKNQIQLYIYNNHIAEHMSLYLSQLP